MAFSAGVATLISAGVGAYSAVQQGATAAAQAETQAAIARQNQQLALDQAGAQRREGYDAMTRKRQEVAEIVARQRAVGGASGARVDTGGLLDLNMDARERGEADAQALFQVGHDNAWNTEIQAWNYANQAAAYSNQAKNARNNRWWNAGTTLIGGVAAAGSMFGQAGDLVKSARKTGTDLPWYGGFY